MIALGCQSTLPLLGHLNDLLCSRLPIGYKAGMRRQFSIRDLLGLVLVLVIVTSLGMGWWLYHRQLETQFDYDTFVLIADIKPDQTEHVHDVLEAAGITATFDGSRVFAVRVSPEKRLAAIEILKNDSATHNYWIEFSE